MIHVAAAAVAARRRLQDEEETMTPYTVRDLAENWEFKFLRSATDAFKNPEVLQRCLDEEAQAGWVLVEKFDNGRLRLKRPASARQNDQRLPFDAYRTHVGMSEGQFALCIAASIIGVLAAGMAILFLLIKGG